MKAALIGTGHIARQHLACVGRMASVELVAVCDISPAAAEIAAERFAVPRWFTDHQAMLEAVHPDVVHVTAPPPVHLDLVLDALSAGSHVIVEKPAARDHGEVARILERAEAVGRHVVECQNYLFNSPVREIHRLWRDGVLGDLVHVDVAIRLGIARPGSPFADTSVPHPALSLPGGAIGDFLPHLASLAYHFIGSHKRAHAVWVKRDASSPMSSDEFRGLVEGRAGGTAALSFSGHGQPDAFDVSVTGTRGRATAGLFEPRVTVARSRPVPSPLVPTLNGIEEGRIAIRAAMASLGRKIAGGAQGYEGLWTLIERTYAALADGGELPVPAEQVDAVHRMIDDLVAGAPGAS